MTILDRLLGHDAWTTRQLLLRCRELSEEQMDRRFDIGDRSLYETFVHVIRNMEVWTGLMLARPVVEADHPAEQERSVDRLLARLTVAAQDFAEVATRVEREGRADDLFVDVLDQPPTKKSLGGGVAHLITHSMHHRAQILYVMEQLGVQNLLEGDALSWEAGMRGWV